MFNIAAAGSRPTRAMSQPRWSHSGRAATWGVIGSSPRCHEGFGLPGAGQDGETLGAAVEGVRRYDGLVK